MRLYEVLNGKVVPYWIRNGLTAGVGLPIPTSELFRVFKVRRIGRGYLWPVRQGGRTILALLAECDRDSGALIMVDAPEVKFEGFLRLSNGTSHVIELLPGGSIEVRGRRYHWNGRDLKRI